MMKRVLAMLLALLVMISMASIASADNMRPMIRDYTGPYTASGDLELYTFTYTGNSNASVTYRASIDGSEYVALTDVRDINGYDIGIVIVVDTSVPYINDSDTSNVDAQWIRIENTHALLINQILDNLLGDMQVQFVIAGSSGTPETSGWMSVDSARSWMSNIRMGDSYSSTLAAGLQQAFDIAAQKPGENSEDPMFSFVVAIVNPSSVVDNWGSRRNESVRQDLPSFDASKTPFMMITYRQYINPRQRRQGGLYQKTTSYNTRYDRMEEVAKPFSYLEQYSLGFYVEAKHEGKSEANVETEVVRQKVEQFIKNNTAGHIYTRNDLLPYADYSRSVHEITLIATVDGTDCMPKQISNITNLPAAPQNTGSTDTTTATTAVAVPQATPYDPLVVHLGDTIDEDHTNAMQAVHQLRRLGYISSPGSVFGNNEQFAYWDFCKDYGIAHDRSMMGIPQEGFDALMAAQRVVATATPSPTPAPTATPVPTIHPDGYNLGDADYEMGVTFIAQMQDVLRDRNYYENLDAYTRGLMDEPTIQAVARYCATNNMHNSNPNGVSCEVATDIIKNGKTNPVYEEKKDFASFLTGTVLTLGSFEVKAWMAIAVIAVLLIAIVLVIILMKPSKKKDEPTESDSGESWNNSNVDATMSSGMNINGTIQSGMGGYSGDSTIPSGMGGYSGDSTMPGGMSGYSGDSTVPGGMSFGGGDGTVAPGMGGFGAAPAVTPGVQVGFGGDGTVAPGMGSFGGDGTVAAGMGGFGGGLNVTISVQGPGYTKSESATISSLPFVVGRGDAANLKLVNDNSVSRAHAVFTFDGSALVLADQSSYHNTTVNGSPVPPNGVMLNSGDVITCGSTQLTVIF